jgi:lipopolysaccharide transport system permease protein
MVTRIGPRSGWASLNIAELWNYRELLWLFTWKDIAVRYKQTLLGAAWAVIQPFFTMVVFTVFFGWLAGLNQRLEKHIPYSLCTYCALLAWQLFSHALNGSSRSIVANRQIITKVYFPRLILPLSALLSGLVDFVIAFVVLLAMMAWFGYWPGVNVIYLPGFVVLALLTSAAVGVWLAALNAMYRDIEYTLPFLVQAWMFVTPIAYPATLVPEQWRWLYGLNPMVGVVEGFRWCLLGAAAPGPLLAVSAATTCLLLVGGLIYFRQMEKTFLDVV